MLKYCAWCGEYQGATRGKGHQIRKNICEIDTTTVCPSCLAKLVKDFLQEKTLRDKPSQA